MFAFTKKQRALHEIEKRRGQASTYTEKLPRDASDLKEFLSDFYRHIMFQRQAEMKQELLKYPAVEQLYRELVPAVIPYEDFWQRYYYRTASVERVMAELEESDAITRRARDKAMKDTWSSVTSLVTSATASAATSATTSEGQTTSTSTEPITKPNPLDWIPQRIIAAPDAAAAQPAPNDSPKSKQQPPTPAQPATPNATVSSPNDTSTVTPHQSNDTNANLNANGKVKRTVQDATGGLGVPQRVVESSTPMSQSPIPHALVSPEPKNDTTSTAVSEPALVDNSASQVRSMDHVPTTPGLPLDTAKATLGLPMVTDSTKAATGTNATTMSNSDVPSEPSGPSPILTDPVPTRDNAKESSCVVAHEASVPLNGPVSSIPTPTMFAISDTDSTVAPVVLTAVNAIETVPDTVKHALVSPTAPIPPVVSTPMAQIRSSIGDNTLTPVAKETPKAAEKGSGVFGLFKSANSTIISQSLTTEKSVDETFAAKGIAAKDDGQPLKVPISVAQSVPPPNSTVPAVTVSTPNAQPRTTARTLTTNAIETPTVPALNTGVFGMFKAAKAVKTNASPSSIPETSLGSDVSAVKGIESANASPLVTSGRESMSVTTAKSTPTPSRQVMPVPKHSPIQSKSGQVRPLSSVQSASDNVPATEKGVAARGLGGYFKALRKSPDTTTLADAEVSQATAASPLQLPPKPDASVSISPAPSKMGLWRRVRGRHVETVPESMSRSATPVTSNTVQSVMDSMDTAPRVAVTTASLPAPTMVSPPPPRRKVRHWWTMRVAIGVVACLVAWQWDMLSDSLCAPIRPGRRIELDALAPMTQRWDAPWWVPSDTDTSSRQRAVFETVCGTHRIRTTIAMLQLNNVFRLDVLNADAIRERDAYIWTKKRVQSIQVFSNRIDVTYSDGKTETLPAPWQTQSSETTKH